VRAAAPIVAASAIALVAGSASAQMRPGMAPPPGGGGGQSRPTQTGPTQHKDVGPRAGTGDDEDENRPQVIQRAEPLATPPTDPLKVSPDVRSRIGTDWDGIPPSPEGSLDHKSWFPLYDERRGDYRFRMIPPLWFEHTRGLRDPSQQLHGVPQTEDVESLYGLLYYRRRSLKLDMDVLFPLFWHVRDRENYVTVVGPLAHRDAPGEHDNWLAPLVFEGERKDGGYFHSPLLLTTSHWNTAGAFTLVGTYFRDRTGSDVDQGIVPFWFHGDNGNRDGARRTYTVVPPLLYYHQERELDQSSTTVIGPVYMRSNPKRDIFDVAPFVFHIRGKPETGGVAEDHLTVFPLFHWGKDPDKSLFVMPGYLRRVTRTADTMITPLVTLASTRNGATSLTAVGPVIPLVIDYRDRDLGAHAWAIAPFYYQSDSPAGHDFLTPLYGHFESYGVSRTHWFFPSLTITTDIHGWETDLHPLVYVGRSDESSHTVLAPIFWDFANPKKRATVAFPVYWRFADGQDDSVMQVAGNTLYMQKRVAGGHDWSFHFLPLFSYGESPQGYFWNFLFGLAGYTREGPVAKIRAFWIPIQVDGPSPPAQTARAR
jgi:hypothetical protein